jgi:hypothetical protein
LNNACNEKNQLPVFLVGVLSSVFVQEYKEIMNAFDLLLTGVPLPGLRELVDDGIRKLNSAKTIEQCREIHELLASKLQVFGEIGNFQPSTSFLFFVELG